MARNTFDTFHQYYEPVTETGCWIWTGSTSTSFGDERGQFRYNGKLVKAHRMSYRIFKGEIPEGMQVNHHCDTTICVNPDHLYVGTHKDNMADRARRGRYKNPKGEQHALAKLTDHVVKEIRASTETQYVLAEKYGVTQSLISLVKRGRIWRHVGVGNG